MAVEQIPSWNKLTYLTPFIGIGACGGAIRALNQEHISWKDLIIRAITGAFGAFLAGLYLKHTVYSFEMQYAIAGAIGAVAPELFKAVQLWIIQKLGGDEHLVDMVRQEQADHPDSDSGSNIPAAESGAGKAAGGEKDSSSNNTTSSNSAN